MTPKNFIAVDLELNQPSNKIIQVGVAIGNVKQLPTDYVVRKWYIDPKEPIDDFIINLTGITDSDIRSNCVSHQTVATELNELVKLHQPWLNAVTWGFNDCDVLRKEFEQHNVEFKHFGGRYIDVKTIYNFLQFSQNRSPKGGLRDAMLVKQVYFDGLEHRADIDAQNTLKMFFGLTRQQSKMFDLLENNSYNND
jgi:inhibitor of KinA sporulation pathway (predicted exonuclease)